MFMNDNINNYDSSFNINIAELSINTLDVTGNFSGNINIDNLYKIDSTNENSTITTHGEGGLLTESSGNIQISNSISIDSSGNLCPNINLQNTLGIESKR